MTKVLLVVAAALFDEDGRILLAQRPEGKSMAGLWEFPGGKLEAGELQPEQQNDAQANYAHKLKKEEALLDWAQSAETLALRVRAFNPFPVAFTLLGNDRIRVLKASALEKVTQLQPGTIANVTAEGIEVACADGVLRLEQIQLAGKKVMMVADVINGQPNLFQPNYVLASEL